MAGVIDRAFVAADAEFAVMQAEGLPGAVASFETNGERRIEAFGVADRGAQFRLGSVAKLTVGALARRLAQAGMLDPSRPLSDFRVSAPEAERVTLEMLGAHQTGYRDALEGPAYRAAVNAAPDRVWRTEEILDRALALPRQEAPRYANTNTILLGEAIKTVLDRPLTEVIEGDVLRPIGAANARFGAAPSLRGYRHGPRPGAIEYGDVLCDASMFNASWSGVAGDLTGDIDDLAAIARTLCRAAWAERPAGAQSLGFCAMYDDTGAGHAGDVPGFSAFAWADEARSVAVATNLSNLRSGENPAERIGRRMFQA